MANIFGTDGIRKKVGQRPMVPNDILQIGYIYGQVLYEQHKNPKVLIAKDTRISCYMFESALESGLIAAGVEVILVGPLCTSGASYLVRNLRLTGGIVITASHNTYEDNGLKFFDEHGRKISESIEKQIEERFHSQPLLQLATPLGKASRLEGASERYIEFCKSTFSQHLHLRDMRLLVDAANGAAYNVAPQLFAELGAEVDKLGVEPNGMNINQGCGVMHPEHAQAYMQEKNYCFDAGLLFDGDADRLLILDEKGNLHDGDAILYLCCFCAGEEQKKMLRASGVVGTEISNGRLAEHCAHAQIEFFRTKVGDRNVQKHLQQSNWPIGGEPSGHIIFNNFHCSGDGIISALQVLAVMLNSSKSLSQLLADFKPYPVVSINLPVENPASIMQMQKVQAELATCVADIKQSVANARIVVRGSGTEPLIRVQTELPDKQMAENCAQQIVDMLKQYI